MPEKNSVRFETKTTLDEAVTLLEDLCQAMHSERMVIARGDESVELSPARAVSISVKARRRGRQEKLTIELSWTRDVLRAVTDEEEGQPEPAEPTSLAEHRERHQRREAAQAAPDTAFGLRRHLSALSRERLYELAQEFDVEGRSKLSKEQLVAALRPHGVTRRLTRVDLLTMARAEDITGASGMKKAELAHALAS